MIIYNKNKKIRLLYLKRKILRKKVVYFEQISNDHVPVIYILFPIGRKVYFDTAISRGIHPCSFNCEALQFIKKKDKETFCVNTCGITRGYTPGVATVLLRKR